MTKTYRDWVEGQDYKLSPEDMASHRHLLKAGLPLLKELQRFLTQFSSRGSSFPITKFSQDEEKKLREAIRIIQGTMVSRALLRTKEPEPLIILGDVDYDRS